MSIDDMPDKIATQSEIEAAVNYASEHKDGVDFDEATIKTFEKIEELVEEEEISETSKVIKDVADCSDVECVVTLFPEGD